MLFASFVLILALSSGALCAPTDSPSFHQVQQQQVPDTDLVPPVSKASSLAALTAETAVDPTSQVHLLALPSSESFAVLPPQAPQQQLPQQQQQQPQQQPEANASNKPSEEGSPRARILQQETEVNPDGSFYNVWNSENGIAVQEQGALKQIGENEVPVRSGQISYLDSEGNQYFIKYVADENGFRVQGDHLPTPPPLPLAIARGLEFIAAHPYVEPTTQLPDNSNEMDTAVSTIIN